MSPDVPGTLYLIDTSAAARMSGSRLISGMLQQLIDDGVAATCVTVDLEAGFSGRNPSEVADIYKFRAEAFVTLPISERAAKRARFVQQLMASRGLHRAAGAMDLLTAAVAELEGAVVLHYDADFEHIASVTGQRQQWLAPRGSLD